jgi:hypothetical protein
MPRLTGGRVAEKLSGCPALHLAETEKLAARYFVSVQGFSSEGKTKNLSILIRASATNKANKRASFRLDVESRFTNPWQQR